jgi:hypothetical protein
MADTRTCEQCGAQFTPRREHARFCSARCRVGWNRERTAGRHVDDGRYAEDSALSWAVVAMTEVTQRLARLRPLAWAQSFAVISEAVWWVTIVDATLVRHHPEAYDDALSARLDERPCIEETFAGLRFVRNQLGYNSDPADFIWPQRLAGGGTFDRASAFLTVAASASAEFKLRRQSA